MMATMTGPDERLLRHLLHQTEESATAALFVQLCRESAPLRRWLWEEFARDEATRGRFAARLKRGKDAPPRRIAELAASDAGRANELARLRAQIPARIFGGRTWAEIEALIAQLRAGRADLSAFLLALQWHRAGARAKRSALLQLAATLFLDEALFLKKRTRLTQLATAQALVADAAPPAARRTSVAFGDWWKLQMLLHILRHPQASYRTRELHAHLASLGLRIDPREIRRFCIRNGISRDMRAGRPALPIDTRTTSATRRRAKRSAPGPA